jgi:hypothetical protein
MMIVFFFKFFPIRIHDNQQQNIIITILQEFLLLLYVHFTP